MSELGDKRRKFSSMIPRLLLYAESLGYEYSLGDGKCRTGHMRNSLHYVGLAQDINLFKDGVYLKDTDDHRELGEYWERIGGSWGGRFGDGNHYSLKYHGRR